MSSLVPSDRLERLLERQRLQDQLDLLKYAEGKIYKILQKHHETIVVYVGSTIQLLNHRFSGHKSFFTSNPNSKYSRYVNDRGGGAEFYIELIENYPCKNLSELLARERHFIVTLKPICNIAMTSGPTTVDTAIERIMITEPKCHKCGFVAACQAKLEIHLKRKIPCDVGKHKCPFCRYRCDDKSNINKHQKICKGNNGGKSQDDWKREIEDLKTILAATRDSRPESRTAANVVNEATIQDDQNNNIQTHTTTVMNPIQRGPCEVTTAQSSSAVMSHNNKEADSLFQLQMMKLDKEIRLKELENENLRLKRATTSA